MSLSSSRNPNTGSASDGGRPGPSAPPVTLLAHRRGKKLFRVTKQNPPLSTALDVDERYDVHDVVGSGSYGTVVRAQDSSTNPPRLVAIKKNEKVFRDVIDGRRIWRELTTHRLLRDSRARNCLNVHRMEEPAEELARFQDVYIISDLYECDLQGNHLPAGILHTIAARCAAQHSASSSASPSPRLLAAPSSGNTPGSHRTLTDGVRCMLADMLSGVADLHALGIVHRDIKPANVLLDRKQVAHVCDFGLARGGLERLGEMTRDLSDHVVTRWYRPPELLVMCPYRYPADVFAIGCVAAELIFRKPIFPGKNYLEQLLLVVTGLHPEDDPDLSWCTPEAARSFILNSYRRSAAPSHAAPLRERLLAVGASPELVGFLHDLLDLNPKLRPTAEEALRHPLVAGLVRPHPDPALRKPCAEQDWSLDFADVSENRVRRAIWNEIHRFNAGAKSLPPPPSEQQQQRQHVDPVAGKIPPPPSHGQNRQRATANGNHR